MISGEKEYGKTALLKQLYKDFFDMKLYPVMVDATELRTGEGDELNNKIAEIYEQQYSNLEKKKFCKWKKKRRCVL